MAGANSMNATSRAYRAFAMGHSSRYGTRRHAAIAKKLGKRLALSHIDAKRHRFMAYDVRLVGVDNQLVSRRHDDGALDVVPIVLHLVRGDRESADRDVLTEKIAVCQPAPKNRLCWTLFQLKTASQGCAKAVDDWPLAEASASRPGKDCDWVRPPADAKRSKCKM